MEMSWRKKLCEECHASKDLNRTLLNSVGKCCVECVKVLVEAGANVGTREHRNGYTSLMRAAVTGNTECVQILIKAGADVNQRDFCGLTALMWAAKNGHVDCMELLLNEGAHVNDSDEFGSTSIIYAARAGSFACLKLLIKAGADVNKQNDDGDTSLTWSLKKEKDDCVDVLIQAGADINVENKYGVPALHHAATRDNVNGVRLLLEAGADVNQVNASGQTALMLARNTDCMKLLIEVGADVNSVDNKGNTALLLVTQVHLKFARLLLGAGAKINMFTKNNHNVLQAYLCKLHELGVYLSYIVPPYKTMVMLLFAAGEIIDGITVEGMDRRGRVVKVPVPDYLLNTCLNLNLKHLCRETVRNHLINMDPHQNLFGRIPQLRLPKPLMKYLLYNVSLDDDDK